MDHPLLGEFLHHLVAERGLSNHTVSAYRSDLQHFLAFLQGQDLCQVGQNECIAFLGLLQDQGYAASSVGRVLAALKTFYRFLKREGKVQESPTALLESPRQWQTVPLVLTPKQMEALLAQPDVSRHQGALDRAILELLYSSGLRVSELCRLTLHAADDRSVRVMGKGSKERLVPLGQQAVAAIDHYLSHFRCNDQDEDREAPLFLTEHGRALSRLYVWQRVKEYARMAGLPPETSPHTIRHTFATHLLENGADVRVIQDMLGHAHIQTTDRYTHVSASHLQKAFDAHHPRLEESCPS
jgi:integrase/recombinase XerD